MRKNHGDYNFVLAGIIMLLILIAGIFFPRTIIKLPDWNGGTRNFVLTEDEAADGTEEFNHCTFSYLLYRGRNGRRTANYKSCNKEYIQFYC